VTKNSINNAVGIYDPVSTPPGDYNITLAKPGLKQLTLGVAVLRVTVIAENAVLQVGEVTQEVTVTAGGAPLLQTETGQQGDIMVASSLEGLPQLGAGITGNDWAKLNISLSACR
jgi:hypothetical protein